MTTAANAPSAPAATVRPVRKRYHVGLRADGPLFHASAGGVGFVRYQILPGAREGEPDLVQRGTVVTLTDEEHQKVLRALRRKVYRKAPWGWFLLVDKHDGTYYPEDGDRLLADFAWIRELREGEEVGLSEPQSLGEIERARKAAELELAHQHEAEAQQDPAEAAAQASVALAKKLGVPLGPTGEIQEKPAKPGGKPK